MEKRRLGRTNHMSSVVIFGAAAFWEIGQEEANKVLDRVLAAGVNHIDIAPSYGQAEERTGPWLESHRDQFFLGCKTMERKKADAWGELHRSLDTLRTDHFDLYQLHAVGTFEELNQATAPGGALETLVEARESGLTRYLGITGHGMHAAAVHAEALERFDFDTVLFPIYPALYADSDYRRDAENLLRMCTERDVGVMIIKSAAKQPWGDQKKTYNTWYEPYDKQKEIDRAVRFALSQPAVTGIASPGDTNILPMVLRSAEKFEPMSQAEQETLIAESRDLGHIFTVE